MSAILKQLLDDLELNDVVYFFGTNKCFEDFYTERGGVPFDATSYDNSFFRAVVNKVPSQYPKGNKSRVPH
jgi:hypothetical protein